MANRDACQLLEPEGRCWLTGGRRTLLIAQDLLAAQGIPTQLSLRDNIGGAVQIEDNALLSVSTIAGQLAKHEIFRQMKSASQAGSAANLRIQPDAQ